MPPGQGSGKGTGTNRADSHMSIPPGHFQNISLQDQEPEGLEGLKRRENIKKKAGKYYKRRENIKKRRENIVLITRGLN